MQMLRIFLPPITFIPLVLLILNQIVVVVFLITNTVYVSICPKLQLSASVT